MRDYEKGTDCLAIHDCKSCAVTPETFCIENENVGGVEMFICMLSTGGKVEKVRRAILWSAIASAGGICAEPWFSGRK